MRIKRFRGKNALEVIAEVKKELGEDALILSSKRVKEDGEVFYEVVAAVDRESLEELRKEKRETGSVELTSLKEELKEIRKMLEEVLSDKLLERRYVKWLEAGVPSEAVRGIRDPVEWIKKKIEEMGETPLSRIQVFVGAPGSGKTTGIFKVASWLKYRKGAGVGVVSLDGRRIGARAQALRFGELLDIPVLVLERLSEAKEFAEEFDYLLVDTPSWGRSFCEEELSEVLEDFPFARVQAVVNAVEDLRCTTEFLRRLSSFPVEGVFLTHVDRLVSGLGIGLVLLRDFPGVSFVSVGERVPEDLHRATKEVLERTFFRGIEKVLEVK